MGINNGTSEPFALKYIPTAQYFLIQVRFENYFCLTFFKSAGTIAHMLCTYRDNTWGSREILRGRAFGNVELSVLGRITLQEVKNLGSPSWKIL